MGMLIFAGLAYALEKDEPDTMFYTLPQTLYWAIITMTSTGQLQNNEYFALNLLIHLANNLIRFIKLF